MCISTCTVPCCCHMLVVKSMLPCHVMSVRLNLDQNTLNSHATQVNLTVLKNSEDNLGLTNAAMAHLDSQLPKLAVAEEPGRLHGA